MIPRRFPATLADSLVYLMGRQSAIDLTCTVWLAGRLDEERLRRAVRLSFDAEPILGCRFVERWFHPVWQRCDDLDERLLCEVLSVEEASPAVESFLTAPIDPRCDPLVRVLLVRGPSDILCLKLAHEAADGQSGRAYLRLLLDIYQRLKADAGYRPAPNLTGTRSMQGIGRQAGLGIGRGRLLRALRGFVTAKRGEGWLLPAGHGDGSRQIHLRLRLAPERVAALVAYGRAQRATLTAVLLAAYCRAAEAVFRPARPDVRTLEAAIDLRRFLPPERLPTAVANLSNSQRFNVGAGLSFAELVAAFRDQLREGLSNPDRLESAVPAVTLYPIMNLLYRGLPFACYRRLIDEAARPRDDQPRGTCLVNLGRLDADLAGFEELAVDGMHWSAGSIEAIGVFVGVTGFRDALDISLHAVDRLIDEPTARSLLEHLDHELPPFTGAKASFCGWGSSPAS